MGAPKGNCFNPNGRPRKPIDWREFEKLCQMQCTQPEIAGFFELDEDTIAKRVKDEYQEDYSVVYKRLSHNGRCSLRRTQFKLAQKSAAMAIFLGKQKMWLGQTDTPLEEIVTEVLANKFDAVMQQIQAAQDARKIAERNNNKEQ